MRRHNAGTWPINCEHCGCPGVKTVLDPDTQRIVWAYEAVDILTERVRVLEAVIADKLPCAERDEAMSRYDPQRGVMEQWCAETRREVWEGEGI